MGADVILFRTVIVCQSEYEATTDTACDVHRGCQTFWPKGRYRDCLHGHWRAGYSAIYVTSSSQCCCTDAQSRKRATVREKMCKVFGGPDAGRMRSETRSLAAPSLLQHAHKNISAH